MREHYIFRLATVFVAKVIRQSATTKQVTINTTVGRPVSMESAQLHILKIPIITHCYYSNIKLTDGALVINWKTTVS